MSNTVIKVGLKSNSAFLFGEMKGNTKGGTTGGLYYRSIIHLTETQFKEFKTLLGTFGSVERSLIVSKRDGVDFSCYLKD